MFSQTGNIFERFGFHSYFKGNSVKIKSNYLVDTFLR